MYLTRQHLKKLACSKRSAAIGCFLYFYAAHLWAAAGPYETISEYEGRYAGYYMEGPWYWSTKRSFNLSLSKVTEGRHGKIFLSHSTLGDCQGSYVVNLNKGPQRDEMVIYSANLHCPKERKPFFVFEISLPKNSPLESNRDFSSQFFLRPAKDKGVRIWGNATLTHLISLSSDRIEGQDSSDGKGEIKS